MNYKYVYGPVASRRLGFSLGIDIIPYKNCSFNCIYCQVGKTTHLDITRRVYVPTADVLEEITHALSKNENIDYITFSGSGEPTLHSELGVMIEGVRAMTSIPIAVLTNSSIIDRADVQNDLRNTAVIAPTLCTTHDDTFRTIHRPHRAIRLSSIIEGLVQFRKSYAGKIWLEVMLIRGINDSDQEMQALKKAIDRIQPDKVHLNTVVRPPLEAHASPVSSDTLEHSRAMIGGKAEIVVPLKKTQAHMAHQNIDRRILDIIQRRPSTIKDIATISGINHIELSKHMARLLEQSKVKIRRHQDQAFYEIDTKEEA
ncbi:radical SAM protein [candidate division WOR-3 bacterium]|nr:radical SAM protein [candidate division WOR-3 bacterium]